MSKTTRNAGLHTTQADSEMLVLQALASPCGDGRQIALPLSALGYAAYPGYSFKAPQGAALAAAKLVRSMQDRGLVGWSPGRQRGAVRGYHLGQAGVRVLKESQKVATGAVQSTSATQAAPACTMLAV